MSVRDTFIRSFLILVVAVLSPAAAAVPPGPQPPELIELRTTSPLAGRSGYGVIQDAQWALNFKLRSTTAPAFVEIRERLGFSSDFDLFVLEDPDDCLDLSHIDPNRNQPIEENCPGGGDEVFMIFHQDPFEVPGLNDSTLGGGTAGCIGPYSSDLVDTPVTDFVSQGGAVPFNEATKSYALTQFGNYRAVGPATSSFTDDAGDCYGYGADDDLRGLVVMANIGGSQIFDTDLTYDPSRIRNMAGLLSRVGFELLDKIDRAAITADLAVTNGMFEQVVFVDNGGFDIGGAPFDGYVNPSFKYRIADGPVETVALVGNFSDAELLDEIRAVTTLPYTVEIRSIVVDGDAPAFIDDEDGNGVFDRNDLIAAGYTPISNQSKITLSILPREFLRVEEDSYECPRNLIFTDLDDDGVISGCFDGDGTSRSFMRVPR